ncbi:hypothetical protein [Saccharopolyspora terrae]|uniref:hypothetical protein n=1 Tax=Saccharopolyspora terrae TaxID=2530384 RepID=UPI00140544D0|nr:hypothetical protein [Saccharopolyspora terrae]
MTVVEPDESGDPAPRGAVIGGDRRSAADDVLDAFERVLEEDGPTIHRGLD